MEYKIMYIPREPVEEHWVWGKKTEAVACILIAVVTVPVLVVMATWMIRQLVAMGV